MQSLNFRLAKLERAVRGPEFRPVRLYAMEGPANLPEGASEAFLRQCGHTFDDDYHNIIQIFVAVGRDLPMKDLTHKYGRQSPAPASALHLQRGRG